jgi:DNA-binding LytR/AlgR family response regulator
MFTAIIADDEPLLRANLRKQLFQLWSELHIIGEATHGQEALQLIRETSPHIAFLDIQMPALSGLEVAAQVQCHVVFITAFDEYALQAFDKAAIDYLLKPVELQRLQQTIQRLKQRLLNPPVDLSMLINSLNNKKNYLQWIKVPQGEDIFLLSVDEIDYFQAGDKYTSLFTLNKEWVVRTPLKEFEEQLNPEYFWRIHRSTIVRVAAISKISRHFGGNLSLQLYHHAVILLVSRAYTYLFR